MNNLVTCGFSYLYSTPVFVIADPKRHSDAVKRITGATYFAEKGVWLFPAFLPFIDDVLYDFSVVYQEGVNFTAEAQEHIDRVRIPRVIRPDFVFVTKPYDHQRDALTYMLNTPRCGIFYDMGLGKTKIVVDYIRHEDQRALILSPTVGIQMWIKELAKHSNSAIRAMALVGTPKAKNKILEQVTKDMATPGAGVTVLVAGYDTAKRYADKIRAAFPYQIVIADESHNLRSYNSERTKAAIKIAAPAHRRILLSGTPTLGNPMHIYGQFKFLAPYSVPDYWAFTRFFLIKSKFNKHIVTGYKNLDMLNDKVQRISIRKRKEDCLDLPPRTITDFPFEVRGRQVVMYNQLVVDACAMLQKGELYEAPHAAAVLQKLLQVLSGMFIEPYPDICTGCALVHACVDQEIKPYTKNCSKQTTPPPQAITRLPENPKLEALEELTDDILANENNKMIVWAYFRAELDMVEEWLIKKEIGYVRVDGSNSNHAPDLAEKFNTDTPTRVYLAQIGTGVALTLTRAAYMVYYGLSYSLDQYLQSMDRNYRIGQTEKVFVYRLVAPGSVLEYVVRALEQKTNIADTITDKIDCILCGNSRTCMDNGTERFSEGCIYKSTMNRVITKPAVI